MACLRSLACVNLRGRVRTNLRDHVSDNSAIRADVLPNYKKRREEKEETVSMENVSMLSAGALTFILGTLLGYWMSFLVDKAVDWFLGRIWRG